MPDAEQCLRAILCDIGRADAAALPGDAPLALSSLEVVHLHSRLEEELAVRIRARHVTPATFACISSMVALLHELQS